MKNLCLLSLMSFLFYIPSVCGQEKPQKSILKNGLKLNGKAKVIFDKSTTTIKNPLELRDPFKQKTKRLGKRIKSYGNYLSEGKYSNIPTIEGFSINDIRIVGVLLGKNRRAIAKIAQGESVGQESYIIKEGMKIGENQAEVKAIVPGGVLLVEKIRNVYDQDEYIETIIPVSTETDAQ